MQQSAGVGPDRNEKLVDPAFHLLARQFLHGGELRLGTRVILLEQFLNVRFHGDLPRSPPAIALAEHRFSTSGRIVSPECSSWSTAGRPRSNTGLRISPCAEARKGAMGSPKTAALATSVAILF